LVERVIALPPLNQYLAQSFIRSAPAYKALFERGEHDTPGVQAFEDLLLRVSEMVCELPQLKAMDLNPVVVDEQNAVVVDVRIVIEDRPPSEEPFAHMAIHPYPDQFVWTHRTPDDVDVTIRPIRPEDAIIEHQFVHALSSQSKYFRFMYAVQDLTPAMLSRLTQIDYDREMALIAVAEIEGVEKEIGVARYVINPDGKTCEFAIVVADEWQGKSIASRLMECLMDIARRKRLQLMEGEVLRENQPMLAFMKALGFSIIRSKEDVEIMRITKAL
jgi:acetyltransferase